MVLVVTKPDLYLHGRLVLLSCGEEENILTQTCETDSNQVQKETISWQRTRATKLLHRLRCQAASWLCIP